MTFANNIHTIEGGTHETGFKAALTRVINDYAHKSGALKENDEPLSGEDVREGMTAVVSVKHPDPQFEGQTKTKLGNADARTAVDRMFSEHFSKFLMEHPAEGKQLIDKAMLANKARAAAKRAREVTRKKSGLKFPTYQASWRITPARILRFPSCSSSKGIPRAVPRSPAAVA